MWRRRRFGPQARGRRGRRALEPRDGLPPEGKRGRCEADAALSRGPLSVAPPRCGGEGGARREGLRPRLVLLPDPRYAAAHLARAIDRALAAVPEDSLLVQVRAKSE